MIQCQSPALLYDSSFVCRGERKFEVLHILYTKCIVQHMSASYALLGILGKQPSYGYDLKKYYDFIYGKEKPLAFGQVYATLSRLDRDKKITVASTEQIAGP